MTGQHHEQAKACSLLPGFFGLALQGVLLAVSIGVLIAKKLHEDRKVRHHNLMNMDGKPKKPRDWAEFMLDSSKQMAGAGWIHVSNILVATCMASFEGNGCEWYWVNIMVDTTLGVFVEYLILQLLTFVLHEILHEEFAKNFDQGEYYSRSSEDSGVASAENSCHQVMMHMNKIRTEVVWSRYFAQLFLWLLCVTGMKFVIVLIVTALNEPLLSLTSLVLSPVSRNPHAELVVVMILTPCVMNAFQFVMTDNFIKKAESRDAFLGSFGAGAAREVQVAEDTDDIGYVRVNVD